MKQRNIITTFGIALLLMSPVCSYATEVEADAEENGVIGLTALYSDTISPEIEDEFTITLADENGNTLDYHFNAYDHQDTPEFYEISPGNYQVYSISYQGKNEELTSEGYIMPSNLTVYEQEHLDLSFAIGKKKGTELAQAYVDTFSMIDNKAIDWVEYYSPRNNDISMYEEQENVEVENTNTTEEKAEEEEEVVQVDSSNKKNKEKKIEIKNDVNIFTRNLPIFVMAGMVGIVAYILHKKGKI